MQDRRLGTAIGDRHADQNVAWGRLGVFDGDIEIALFGENPSIEELIFGLGASAPAVYLEQFLVGKGSVGILVERPAVAVRRGRILIVVELLHVLAVIALGPRQPEQTLLQNRIRTVPQGKREAQPTVLVA